MTTHTTEAGRALPIGNAAWRLRDHYLLPALGIKRYHEEHLDDLLIEAQREAAQAAITDAAGRLSAWAECVMRLVAVAPTENVMDEVGMLPHRHSTPPEREAIRERARAVVEGWLARDLAILDAAAEAQK